MATDNKETVSRWPFVLVVVGLFVFNLFIFGPFQKSADRTPDVRPTGESASDSSAQDIRPPEGDRRQPRSPGPNGSPPPRQGSSARGQSFELLVGAALLSHEDASVRLDAEQRGRIKQILAAALPAIENACQKQAELQQVLSEKQIAYLNDHRGPFTYKGRTVNRPSVEEVLVLLDQRRKEASSVAASPSTGGDAGDRAIALDLTDLEAAPMRLESESDVKLTPAQAERFHGVLTQTKTASEKEEQVVATIRQTLRPAQLERIEQITRQREALRRTVPLALVIETLSRPGSPASER